MINVGKSQFYPPTALDTKQIEEKIIDTTKEMDKKFSDTTKEMEERVAGIAETAKSIDERLTGTAEEVAGLTESTKSIDERLAGTAEEVAGLTESTKSIDERLAGTTEEVAGLTDSTKSIDERLAGTAEEVANLTESKKATDEELTKTNETVGKLSTTIKDLDYSENGSYYWTPPPQQATTWGKDGIPKAREPEGVIEAIYEPLRKEFPDYISRELLGKDQSDTYNIYRYTFTPKSYVKTVILSGGTHGNEYTSFFVLWSFLKNLARNWRSHPQLANIRNNVRIIVLPLINPWGFFNNKRQNVNGVDLNRNTDYLWNTITGTKFQPGGANYKGATPFSEVESRYFKETIETYSEAVAALDFHTIITVQAEHIVYTPRYLNQHRHIFDDVIDWLYKPGNRIVNGTSAVPTLSCWAGYNHHMTVANPEWYNGLFGGNRDSVEMTECLKFFANVIIEACNLKNKTYVMDNNEPFSKLLMYDNTGISPITLTSANFNNIPHTLYDLNFKRHGILKLTGYIKISLTEAASVTINPFFYQLSSPDFPFTKTKDEAYNIVSVNLPAGDHVLPLNALFNPLPYNYNEPSGTNRPQTVKLRIRGKVTAGTLTVEAYRVYIDFTPTDRGTAYEILNFTGNEAKTEGQDYASLFPVYIVDDNEQ